MPESVNNLTAHNQTGIIIQARTGSERLPGKVVKPFYHDKTILEIIIGRFSQLNYPIIVATTPHAADDMIVEIAQKCNAETFRGAEQDVLQRFIDCANEHQLSIVLRVCADNPFPDISGIAILLDEFKKQPVDYLSYQLSNGTPAIKSHLGFWAEIVSINALKRVAAQTAETIYHEHVTNYIYTHADEFKVKFLPAPSMVSDRMDIRLTLDTAADFELLQQVFSDLTDEGSSFELKQIVDYLDQHPGMLELMNRQIELNTK